MCADISVIRQPRPMIMIDDFNALKTCIIRRGRARLGNITCLQIISSILEVKIEGRYPRGLQLKCNYKCKTKKFN